MLKGWVSNLAAPVFSSDTKVIEAINAGHCALGIVNTYYLGRLLKKDPTYPVQIFLAKSKLLRGARQHFWCGHRCVIPKTTPAALVFLEWLSQGEAQRMFADINLEYPISSKVARNAIVQGWGDFKSSSMSLSRIGSLQKEAIKVMDRARYLLRWPPRTVFYHFLFHTPVSVADCTCAVAVHCLVCCRYRVVATCRATPAA